MLLRVRSAGRLLVVAAVIVCAGTGCPSATPPSTPSGTTSAPSAVPADEPNEPAAEKRARTHAYWQEPLAPERFRWLIGEIQNTPPGRSFIFDRRAHQNARMATSAIRKPEDVAEAGIPQPAWVNVRGQWSREKAVAELLDALDEAVKRRSGQG